MWKKDGQDIPIKQGTLGFKTFQSVLEHLDIQFGTRSITRYGLPDMVNMLQVMAVNKVCANSAHQIAPPGTTIPHGDWLTQKINLIEYDSMVDKVNKMIGDTIDTHALKLARRNGDCQTRIVAIDKHKIAHYDKNPDMKYLINSKYEAGTGVFESYITAKIVSGAKEFHLSMIPVTRGTFNPEFVRETIKACNKSGADASLYLLDREFYASDVMSTIQDMNKHFIIPAKKDAGIKGAISEHAQGKRAAISQYTFGDGNTFNLIIIPAPRKTDADNIFERYHVFATSLPCIDADEVMRYVPNMYKKRWGIETGYRQNESIRPHTTSKNPVMRMLLFAVSLIIANIWTGIRVEVAHKTYDITLVAFVTQMMYAYVESHSSWPPPRRSSGSG